MVEVVGVFFDLRKANIKPVSLGWVNGRNTSHYFVRIPMRRDWRQGLRSNNSTTLYGRGVLSRDTWPLIAKTITNDYPPYKDVLKAVVSFKKGGGRAFSRDFALFSKEGKEHLNIRYRRGINVGYINPKENKIMLNDNSRYLYEAVKENINDFEIA